MTEAKDKVIPILQRPLVFNRSMSNSLSKMVQQLLRSNIAVLSGSSGSGKSTFATKTLCQFLQSEQINGKNGPVWRTVVTAPFADPIGNLAKALARRDALFPKDGGDLNQVTQILRNDPHALTTLFKQAQGKEEKFNLLLVVDQKDELYRYRHILKELNREGDVQQYVDLLLNAVNNDNEDVAIYLVFVADTENFDYFADYKGLPEVMNNFRIELAILTVEEIETILDTYKKPETLAIYQKHNQNFVKNSGQEPKDNFAFFEWLADKDQEKFVHQLLVDFKHLSGDFAAKKFNMFLCWVIEEYTHAVAKNPALDILEVYRELGPMNSVIQNLIEKKVWKNFTTEQQKHTELLFKALTVPTFDEYRPLRWGDLEKLVNRNGLPFTEKDAREITSIFNATYQTFFLPVDWAVWPDKVVDISAKVLIYEWDMPQIWIDEEQKHADIYRDLVRKAITYSKEEERLNGGGEAGMVPQKDALWAKVKEWWSDIYPTYNPRHQGDKNAQSRFYNGISLANALKWMAQQQPNADWAARYDPSLNDQYLRDKIPAAISKKSNWDLAKEFLDLSAHQEQLKSNEEESTRKRAISLQRKSVITAAIAIVAGIAAIGFWAWADRTNQTVKMIDFVELLEANGCLNIAHTERFNRMFELTEEVWKKKLSTEEDVLEYLAEVDVLLVDKSNQDNKRISFDALTNIGALAVKQIIGDTSGQTQILTIYEQAQKKDPEYQYPSVYYALLNHINTFSHRLPPQKTVATPKAAIEESALASNPDVKHEYAYGDKNGHIFIKNEQGTYSTLNLGKVIKSMAYGADGQQLYIGTEDGEIFLHEFDKPPSSNEPADSLFTKIWKNEGKTVYFAEEWDKDHLLVSTTDQVYFLHRKNATENFKVLGGSIITIKNPKRVGYTNWSPDHKWFFAAGQDATAIFRVDPLNANLSTGLEEVAQIQHTGITMVDLAIKFDDLGRLWLALGSEEGDIWLAASKSADLLKVDCNVHDKSLFDYYPNAHESTITGLEFNKDRPQMASSGRDGYVYLWNLEKPEAKFDRIRLRNRGEGISAIIYVNPDELVAYESIDSWVIQTNIKKLREKLGEILQILQHR